MLVAEREVARVRQVARSVSHDLSWWMRDHHEPSADRLKFPAQTCGNPIEKQLNQ